MLSNAPVTNGAGNVDTITDYTAGQDIVDITDILKVAGGTNVITGGFLRVTTNGLVQVDLDGGANSWVTLANINTGVSPVTVRYMDGNTATNVNVTPAGTGMEAPTFKVAATAPLITTTNEQQQAANSNSVLVGAMAAAGLMSASQAAAHVSDNGAQHLDSGISHMSLMAANSLESVDQRGLVTGIESPMTMRDGGELSSDGASFHEVNVTNGTLAGHAAAEAPAAAAQLPAGNEMPVASQPADAPSFAGGDVAMPSLEALAASVGQHGAAAQEAGNVAQVIADALAGGGGDTAIDSLLASIPGQGGGAADGLATMGMSTVPTWDMGAFGGFTTNHLAATMETLEFHQAAVVQQA